jgi:heptosyltransferase-2
LKKFLVIQTAFIGDVILATSIIEKLHAYFKDAQIDVLVRKGNESLLDNHPFINQTLVWNKKKHKLKNLFSLTKQIRKTKYDYVINLHRFASSGFITWRSGAKYKYGFDKNPFSLFFTKKFSHQIGNGMHEVERNHLLIKAFTDDTISKPKLYPSKQQYIKVKTITSNQNYIVIAPSSVWFTKQVPKSKIIELINKQPKDLSIYLIGAPSDKIYCQSIIDECESKNIQNLAGKLNLLESAVLIEQAKLSYVNDSAPLHLASAMNAPVKAFFCSTVPEFGFGPLSEDSEILQVQQKLSCRPCGLHGHKICPKGHFKCGLQIELKH